MTGSKFSALRAMREQRAQDTPEVPARATDGPRPVRPEPVTLPVTPDPVGEGPVTSELPRRRVGRPPGKRSNPEYQQVTVLLRGQTYLEVRKRLLDERREVSDLLNDLLDDWLKR